jgi:hypothetical protein
VKACEKNEHHHASHAHFKLVAVSSWACKVATKQQRFCVYVQHGLQGTGLAPNLGHRASNPRAIRTINVWFPHLASVNTILTAVCVNNDSGGLGEREEMKGKKSGIVGPMRCAQVFFFLERASHPHRPARRSASQETMSARQLSRRRGSLGSREETLFFSESLARPPIFLYLLLARSPVSLFTQTAVNCWRCTAECITLVRTAETYSLRLCVCGPKEKQLKHGM